MTKRVLIITPTYNEQDNLRSFAQSLNRAMPSADILVVDDNSPDGTGALADGLAEADTRIHVMHRAGKLGIGSAYLEGFGWALDRDYDVVCQMDTDLSHNPVHLPAFLSAIDAGADVVLGSRNMKGGHVEGWGVGRHLLSKGGSLYSRSVLGLPIRDLTSGFKAFRRRALEALPLEAIQSEGYAFQIEITYRAMQNGMTVVEVPIVFVDRRAGKSKMSRRIFWEAVCVVWKLRFA
ncbi:MAG: polyprenol monophosphomannose synthase [Myxococcales bacterium]|nr:polyprenol monophosphomannose synthase [Myxococcales bacterium]MCB9708942.1 polyprenol monophosphomannose synthase [Myxococcales bacterium]